jgi:hypothetical protein
LRERARILGWADERIVVIDQDLGHSGASTVDRLGFQHLELIRKPSGSRINCGPNPCFRISS